MSEVRLEIEKKIPVWGLLGLGLAQVLVGYNWINDIDKRLMIREASSVRSLERLGKLEQSIDRVTRVEEQLKHLVLVVERMEKKLDRQSHP